MFRSSVQQSAKRFYSKNIPLPKCNFLPKTYKGPSLDNLKNLRKKSLNPALTTYYSSPLPIYQGYKQWLFDTNGKRYLDMFGGICTVSVGHSHPKIAEAVNEQMNTLGHISNLYLHPKIHEYAERLTQKMPGDLKVAYFVNSGSEANDLAILLARAYTNNFNVISLQNCYHGMSGQTMALTSSSVYKYPVPQNPGFHKTMNPDVYRGLWGGQNCRDSPVQTNRQCSCNLKCEATPKYLEQLSNLFIYNLAKNDLAAFFAESIQGIGGTVQFPKDYFEGVYKIVKQHGGLFISDEVQTGFARTGEHFWGFEMHNIVPDIVTMAKGIGNGFPLGAVVTTPKIASALTRAAHFNTFGGNPVASAAGLAVLDIIEEEELQKNCLTVGTYLLKGLSELRDKFPIIGDVRGKGLMIGIEMITENSNRVPLESGRFMKIWENCRDMGLLLGKGGYFGNVFRIKPPMCVTKEDTDFTISVIENVLKDAS